MAEVIKSLIIQTDSPANRSAGVDPHVAEDVELGKKVKLYEKVSKQQLESIIMKKRQELKDTKQG